MLRRASVYGGARPATQAFLSDLSRRRWWITGPPAVIVHPTYVEDVVQVIALCLDSHDLAGERSTSVANAPLSLDDWARAAARALQSPLRHVSLPANGLVAASPAASALLAAVRISPPRRLARMCQPMLSRALDTTRARQQLGFVPMPMERALADTIATARALGAIQPLSRSKVQP